MSIYVPKFNDNGFMPYFEVLKTPVDYWKNNWGISYKGKDEKNKLKAMGREQYTKEWSPSCRDKGVSDVSAASIKAGLSDAPVMLNEENARIISELVKYIADERKDISEKKPIKIMSIGEGPGTTTSVIYKHIPDELKKYVFFFIAEPAKKAYEDAVNKLLKMNINFNGANTNDLGLYKYPIEDDFDIVTAVAGPNHHTPDQRDYYRVAYSFLRNGGFSTDGDWCDEFSTHPYFIGEFYKKINKMEMYEKFIEAFPNVLSMPNYPIKTTEENMKKGIRATERFMPFWIAYYELKKAKPETMDLCMSEGHDVAEKKITYLRNSYFDTESDIIKKLGRNGIINGNPYNLNENDSLHVITLGQKLIL
ncbi:MAG TPA: hypothetical protein VJB11_01975 [archaeon]|nr:hypothetical protein [archaeon]